MPKTIYFIRHGETEAIVNGVMAGRELDTPLNENGKQEAKAAGKLLRDKNIELVVTSPMMRTRHTARIIAKELGIDEADIIENELFIERAFGSYSGKTREQYLRHIDAGTLDDRQLESTEALFNRISKALDWLGDRPEKTILVVSHGATGRMFRVINQQLPHHHLRATKQFATAEIDKFTL